jgi:hypothetical protein
MVDTQVRPSDVTKFPIIDAMLACRARPSCPKRGARWPMSAARSRGRAGPRSAGRAHDRQDARRGRPRARRRRARNRHGPRLLHRASGAYRRGRGRRSRKTATSPPRPRRRCADQGIDNAAVVVTGPLAERPCQGRPLRRHPPLRRGRGLSRRACRSASRRRPDRGDLHERRPRRGPRRSEIRRPGLLAHVLQRQCRGPARLRTGRDVQLLNCRIPARCCHGRAFGKTDNEKEHRSGSRGRTTQECMHQGGVE